MSTVVEVQNLVKQYKNVRAIDDISFSIEAGRCVGLLGGNGAGKTTTLGILMGVTTPTSGSVLMLGHDMASDKLEALARMNFTSPYTDLPFRLTVWQNLYSYAYLYGVENPRERVKEVLARFNLTPYLDRPSGKLSAGQRTRLGLAKAFLNNPELVLLDEPSASLDPDTADKLRSDIERYRRDTGATFILASHNMAEVERLCDEVIMMRQGKILDRATPSELIHRYGRQNLEEVFLAISRGEDAVEGEEMGHV